MDTQVERPIRTEAELRALIPPPSGKTPLKVLPRLDPHCLSFLALARVAAVSMSRPGGLVDVSLRGGPAGFALARGDSDILLPLRHGVGREAENAHANPFAGLVFLIPGIDETLRVNGAATLVTDAATLAELAEAGVAPPAALRIRIEEAFLHCPKAFIRSHLWDPASQLAPASLDSNDAPITLPALDARCRAVIAASPFIFLATGLKDRHADVSPRGDPRGFVHVLDDRTLLVPDRPGNRLLDNWRNVLANPSAAVLFVVPGLPDTLRILGRGELVADEGLLEPLSVQGKRPVVALRLVLEEAILERSDLAASARLWDPAARVPRTALPTFGRMLVDQVDPDGGLKGLKAAVVEVFVKRESKKGLY